MAGGGQGRVSAGMAVSLHMSSTYWCTQQGITSPCQPWPAGFIWAPGPFSLPVSAWCLQGALMVTDEELLAGFQRCRELGALPQVTPGHQHRNTHALHTAVHVLPQLQQQRDGCDCRATCA